jgi:ribonuclease HIII
MLVFIWFYLALLETTDELIRLNILGEDPKINLPEGTGKNVEELIRQMIQKDPKQRLNI